MIQPIPVKTPIPTAAEWEAFFAYYDRLKAKVNYKANREKP
jgi:hypothetical protein